MKLLTHSATRKGDIATVLASWQSRTRQGAAVNLALLKGTDGYPVDAAVAAQPLIQADIVDVQGTMFGIAKIAWSWGWRPAGLQQALLDLVAQHGKGPRP